MTLFMMLFAEPFPLYFVESLTVGFVISRAEFTDDNITVGFFE